MRKLDAAGRIHPGERRRPLGAAEGFSPIQYIGRLRVLRNHLDYLNGCVSRSKFCSEQIMEMFRGGTLPLSLLMLNKQLLRFESVKSDPLQRARVLADNFLRENHYNNGTRDKLHLNHLDLLLDKLIHKSEQTPRIKKLSYDDLRKLNAEVQREAAGRPNA